MLSDRMERTEETICELKDQTIEIAQSEQDKIYAISLKVTELRD